MKVCHPTPTDRPEMYAMRRFHSYGPVIAKAHYSVPRLELVDQCVDQLLGTEAEEHGHYFTIWAPRQTGKTWLMQQAVEAIKRRHGDKYIVAKMSMQSIDMVDDDTIDTFLSRVPKLMRDGLDVPRVTAPSDLAQFQDYFGRKGDDTLFDRPVVLLIDEFDDLPQPIIDRLIRTFRDLYLQRDNNWLHGLALIGVRSVLGVESRKGSPFNIQRSINVPNLTHAEVTEMFDQFRSDSGQEVEIEVVEEIYRITKGQPGLVGWFGELLTEKYNKEKDRAITMHDWTECYIWAKHVEPNNTVLNLLAKARGEYLDRVLTLFANPNTPFDFRADWCNHLYMNGIITPVRAESIQTENPVVCRFSSPFVQETIYRALTSDLVGDRLPLLVLDVLDELEDVFTDDGIVIPKLLERYKSYLLRLEAAGINPWKDQPRRSTDLQLQESVGHFHLYGWLRDAIGRRCVIAAEFPTGNGKVDLHLKTEQHEALIEIKSFTDMYQLIQGRKQAAQYAKQCGLNSITVVVCMPVKDEATLNTVSGTTTIDDVEVSTVAIGW